jgi:thioredoxin reductase (NADPH)
MEATVPLVIAAVSLFLLALGAIADDRRTRVRRSVVQVELPLLHSINDDRCIGCEACVDVCPTEVLDLVDHKVRVVRFSDCVQCEQCANACPTTALVMYREGLAPQTLTVPELDDNFMTGVPGQYLIGEVAGKPLVKNAANLGRAVIEHIARDLGKSAPQGVLDVVIVGSGPGGLSAGLTCLVKKLSCVVLEKEHVLASTVARYPKGKLFMAEPAASGNLSYLPVFDASKEDLVGTWQKVVTGTKLPVKLGEAVESVKRGDDGVFTVKTTVATYRARSVVLATGLRGKPRLLAVPGANLEKVQSRLEDPDTMGGKHVLVVGGGDSAVEAAMSLVDAGAIVTLSYRGDGFKRCKQGNQKRLAEMTAANKLPVHLESNVTEFTAAAVSIKLKDGTLTTIPNHHAFVLIGADTPVAWLEANNVRFIEREHLYALGSTQDVVRRIAPDALECAKQPDEAISIVLGHTPRASRPATRADRNERSIVSRIRDEFGEVVGELTGVFKIGDLAERRKKVATPVPRERAKTHSKLVPVSQLTRMQTPPKLFAHHDPERPYTPAGTTVEMMSLPALLEARAAKQGRKVTQHTVQRSEVAATVVDGKAYRAAPVEPPASDTIVDGTAVPKQRAATVRGATPIAAPRKTPGSYGPMRPTRDGMTVDSYPVVRKAAPPPIPAAPPRSPVPARVATGTNPPPIPRRRVGE